MRRRFTVCAAALTVASAPAASAVAMAQSGGWRPDERILISDFSVVTALARSSTQLFAATAGGLIVIDDGWSAAPSWRDQVEKAGGVIVEDAQAQQHISALI